MRCSNAAERVVYLKIIADTSNFYLEKETAAAIGKFDGIHIGHRKLLEEILSRKKDGLAACVFTFDPAPAVLFGTSDGRELTTREEKRLLFERMGVDILIEFPLTRQTAAMPPVDFVRQVLVKQMKAKFLAAGSDLSFGAGGAGNANLLKDMSFGFDFSVEIIPKVCVEDREVSSTLVREQVEAGDMEMAQKLLGIPYLVAGEVVSGNKLGRTLGFPTINLLPADSKLLPPNGVYFSQVGYGGKLYRAISNVGYKPTVTKKHVMGVESYLYGFDSQIYGESVEVYLLKFRRPEQQFESLDALRSMLREDIDAGALHENCCL